MRLKPWNLHTWEPILRTEQAKENFRVWNFTPILREVRNDNDISSLVRKGHPGTKGNDWNDQGKNRKQIWKDETLQRN